MLYMVSQLNKNLRIAMLRNGLQKSCRVGFGLALGVFIASAVQAQVPGAEGLQYRVIDGQVYAYQANDPTSLYRIPSLTPQQVGLGGEAEAQERARAAAQARAYGTYPQNQGYGWPNYPNGSGFPYMQAPQPARPAAANDGLPAITFRDPVFSPQNLPRQNPIGGLPRYPGRNY